MSHSERFTDKGRTSVFYKGAQYGTQKERERIARLVYEYQVDACKCDTCFTIRQLEKEIKGEIE